MNATLVSDIVTGKLDSDLDRLEVLIRERRKTLANSVLFTLHKGDKVRFNNHTRPTYLRGLTGTVEKINQSSASVILDKDQYLGRFQRSADFSLPIRVPSSLLEKAS